MKIGIVTLKENKKERFFILTSDNSGAGND